MGSSTELLYKAIKVFGLQNRKLKLVVSEIQIDEITGEILMKTSTKTVHVSLLSTTAAL